MEPLNLQPPQPPPGSPGSNGGLPLSPPGGAPPPQPPFFGPPSPESDENEIPSIAALEAMIQQGFSLSGLPDPDEKKGPPPGPIPGEDTSKKLWNQLGEDGRRNLAALLTRIRDDCRRSMSQRNDMENEIRKAYALSADSSHSGTGPEPAGMCSHLTKYMVDQVAARLSANMMGVKPLAAVEAVGADNDTDSPEIKDRMADAAAMERTLQEYARRELRFERLLPRTMLRCSKVGTAVIHAEWQSKRRKTKHYEKTTAQPVERIKDEGKLKLTLVPNRMVTIWPIELHDWQEEYVVVGHDEHLDPAAWRAYANSLGIDEETIKKIETFRSGAEDLQGQEQLDVEGFDSGPVLEYIAERVVVSHFNCNMAIPGYPEGLRFEVRLHPLSGELLWIDENRWFTQKHGFFPIRYKWVDEFAWGEGVGHEVYMHQAGDSTLWNIQIDSIFAGAYYLILRKPETMHEEQTERPMPGQNIPCEDPEHDLKPVKMGGPLPEVAEAREDIQESAKTSGGIPPVLSGMGDPTQKSGTGSGATQALIEQAGQKIGFIDSMIRTDLGDLFQFIAEVLLQCAPDELFYRYASDEDARALCRMRLSPRGELSELFEFRVQAPSATTSKEGRRASWLMLWQHLKDYVQSWMPIATEVLQTENPGAIPRLQRAIAECGTFFLKRLLEDYDVPGGKPMLPGLPDPAPEDQQRGALLQQLDQVKKQLQDALKAKPKPPAESIPIDKLPQSGQIQMAAQAGIHLTPQDFGQGAAPGPGTVSPSGPGAAPAAPAPQEPMMQPPSPEGLPS